MFSSFVQINRFSLRSHRSHSLVENPAGGPNPEDARGRIQQQGRANFFAPLTKTGPELTVLSCSVTPIQLPETVGPVFVVFLVLPSQITLFFFPKLMMPQQVRSEHIFYLQEGENYKRQYREEYFQENFAIANLQRSKTAEVVTNNIALPNL